MVDSQWEAVFVKKLVTCVRTCLIVYSKIQCPDDSGPQGVLGA